MTEGDRMDEIRKNKLDLEYNNLLNWRTIAFGSYFALVAVMGTYMSAFFQSDILTFSISLLGLSAILWIIIDNINYRKINERLNAIELELESLR